jgi:hypothetical protein
VRVKAEPLGDIEHYYAAILFLYQTMAHLTRGFSKTFDTDRREIGDYAGINIIR